MHKFTDEEERKRKELENAQDNDEEKSDSGTFTEV